MDAYYFHNAIDKFVHFLIDELKRQPIDKNTVIWKDGMKDWTKAAELEELRSYVGPTPPEFNLASLTEQVEVKIGRNLGLAIIILIAGIIAIWTLNKNYRRNTCLPLPPPVVGQERVNPVNFLSARGTCRVNFWQNKWTINGNISNFASHANYKDVIVKVNFLSQTNTVIGSKQYVLYDYFPYGLKKGVTMEIDKPAVAATCGLQAINATVY
jgi:GYF domain 2